jgi:HD superfamily phosphodiesterase
MKLNKKIEAKIKQKAIKLLGIGRTNFDIRHTLCAVKWIKKLVKLEGGNEKILIPAIYFHDTGYDELPLGYNHQQCLALKKKKDHGEIGAELAKKYLARIKYFTKPEIEKIAYLVKNHNKHGNIKKLDRQLVFEADGFAQIDWSDCRPSYDKKNCVHFLKTTFKHRKKYIKTKSGKKIVKNLLAKTKKYLADWPDNK